ncbi:bifunctional alpha,alpha-trehalose-phosphate synthase (UDP-forming)/trehalose-phosphatase [uncultured Alistipes sp.]|uniref:bifunctional alpha,alpha-trehalose-phosphate synthase (UDP-forming)/trehalose-phosphatase n=1 Tax=uncultured Alistipes sp. TaxID=538949 RepID=UPI0025971681|nr:bifunctional alpha,alpha-trehalose-phosphate synthase (UDP-forming)/trehalose-phosphatase [uncultured Alistipes sp.]
MKLFIISNRLPVKVSEKAEQFLFTRSEGGLATGLDSLHTQYEKHWIGWPGLNVEKPESRQRIREELEKLDFHPVFLSAEQIENYYEGYSNSTIWPLCHYFFSYTQYRQNFWETYREVNRLFCEEVRHLVGSDDIVWVQDYQLMLLPGMLREIMPTLCIGYFHHIPFPSYELFRVLPERAELLRGMLGADLIAFHTHDYVRHFISTAERVLHMDFRLDEAQIDNRFVQVDALPMGIDYEKFHRISSSSAVKPLIARTRAHFGDRKLVLSVDRLDYSKGIRHRLHGFDSFLKHHPEYLGKVTLAMVIVPSRDRVGSYADLKTRIDEEISAINGRYSTMDWTPVCYFYHGFSFEELTAMYYVADVALVTPLRDGMNLVAKEYIAVKDGNPGVLILSEMAGASVELADAIRINPNDTEQIASALAIALEMPVREQLQRIRRMQTVISEQTVNRWAADFMAGLAEVCRKNRSVRQRQLTPETLERILHTYRHTRQRLLLFDYDGTLAPICSRPEEAAPGRELYKVLCTLVADRSNRVVINSGRDHATMERWFGKLPVSLAAEHGAFYREGRGGWHANPHHAPWDPELLELMNRFVERTPHSRLEQKQTALAWHYRETDEWLGTLRAQQLMTALIPLCMRLNLQIMPGSKVVEVKSPEFSKGSEVRRLLRRERYDFILAMGDDTTDDDMFRALPRAAVTVKVGAASEYARYNLWRQSDVLPFLERLAASGSTGHSVRETVTRGLRTVWGHFRNLLTNKKDDDEK